MNTAERKTYPLDRTAPELIRDLIPSAAVLCRPLRSVAVATSFVDGTVKLLL
jgi:hypothetical protein